MIDSIQSICPWTEPDHNGMKLEINNRRKSKIFKNLWKLYTQLKKNGSKKSQGKLENAELCKHNTAKFMGHSISGTEEEIYIYNHIKKQIHRWQEEGSNKD